MSAFSRFSTVSTGISQMALRPQPSRDSHSDCIRCSALSKLNPGSGHRAISVLSLHNLVRHAPAWSGHMHIAGFRVIIETASGGK